MANTFTLDNLREEVEKKYAPIVIELPDGKSVALRNLLRLSKKDRDAALETLKSLESDSDDSSVEEMAAAAASVLSLVCDNSPALEKAMGNDLPLMMKVLEVWMGASQPGEAESSPVS